MLIVSGAGALGAPMSELTTLKQRVDQCVRSFPITGNNDAAASRAASCSMFVGGSSGASDGIKAFEKVTLIDDADNALLFNIVQTLLTNWRNTDMNGAPSTTEIDVRRIAAQKLGEASVFDAVSPTLAVQTLSSAGRIESANAVRLAIARSLHTLLTTRDIPANIRTEATTTLKIFADPQVQNDPFVLNAANDALKALAPKIELDIGPVTVISKPRSKYKIPLIAMGVTAVASTVGLWWFLYRHPMTGLSGAGPLRRRVEAALRRRRAR